jgi:hypothetical protein
VPIQLRLFLRVRDGGRFLTATQQGTSYVEVPLGEVEIVPRDAVDGGVLHHERSPP